MLTFRTNKEVTFTAANATNDDATIADAVIDTSLTDWTSMNISFTLGGTGASGTDTTFLTTAWTVTS